MDTHLRRDVEAHEGQGGPRVPGKVVSLPHAAARKSKKVVARAQGTPQPTD